MSFSLEDLAPLSPAPFFQLSVDISKGEKIPSKLLRRSFLLPDTSELFPEAHFANVWMAWHEKGLSFEIEVEEAFENCFFPEFRKGDSVELFIDTRDLKTAKSVHRFCHHLCFLPQEVNGIQIHEMTRFRAEDSRPLIDCDEIEMKTEFASSSYTMTLFIPGELLFGYEPLEFSRLGFTYRINRFGKKPAHFSTSSLLFSIENHPALWSSLKLYE
jgi:hypothetical protein